MRLVYWIPVVPRRLPALLLGRVSRSTRLLFVRRPSFHSHSVPPHIFSSLDISVAYLLTPFYLFAGEAFGCGAPPLLRLPVLPRRRGLPLRRDVFRKVIRGPPRHSHHKQGKRKSGSKAMIGGRGENWGANRSNLDIFFLGALFSVRDPVGKTGEEGGRGDEDKMMPLLPLSSHFPFLHQAVIFFTVSPSFPPSSCRKKPPSSSIPSSLLPILWRK